MTLPRKPSRGQAIRADLIGQIIDYMREITPVQGPNILVSRTPGGSVISGKPGGAGGADSGTAPWTVRKHVTEDDENGQWEIWLPPGCMSVGAPLTPINKPASEASGHDDDRPGWYALHLDEGEGDETTETSGTGDSQVTTASRTWNIVAHAKTSAKMSGVDALDSPARRLLYVSAQKVQTDDEAAEATDAQQVANTWGDEFSQIVATVKIGTSTLVESDAKPFRKTIQASSVPISVQGRARTNFDLVWYFKFSSDGALEVDDVYCTRTNAAAAGLTLEGPTLTKVTGAEKSIYAKVLTNPLNPDPNSGTVEVVMDPSGMQPDNFVTWLRLYDMSSNAVVADFRTQSLANLQVYR